MVSHPNVDEPIEDDNDKMFDSFDILQIVHLFLQGCMFCVGIFIHLKTIVFYLEEKIKTWKMHVFHAGMLIMFFGVQIFFQAITHYVPNLSTHIGSWICYIGSFNSFYGYHAVLGHSLWISIEKYVLIVHTSKIRKFGEEKLEQIFFLVDMIVPLVLTMIAMITTNHTRSEIKSCFGNMDYNLEKSNTSLPRKFIFCDISEFSESYWMIAIFIQCLCVSRAILNMIMASNMPEGIFYYKVFKTMQRQTRPAPENQAVLSLSYDIQERNIRKVAVNARVTSVLWLSEIVAMIWSTLQWVFINGTTNAGTLTNSMVWFYIMIPYTHLINIRYNKDRIVDNGWERVVLNAVESLCPACCKPADGPRNENGSMLDDAEKKKPLSRIGKENKRVKEETTLSVISIEFTPEEFFSKPGTSKKQEMTPKVNPDEENMTEEKILHENQRPDSSIDSETDDGFQRSPPKSYRLQKGTQILSLMSLNSNKEDAYIHYFQQLLELEHLAKDDNCKHLTKHLDIALFAKSSKIRPSHKIKKKTSLKHKKINMMSPEYTRKTIMNSKNKHYKETILNIDFVLELEERTKQRQRNLDGFLKYCNNEEMFDYFVKKLTIFEEGLIKE